MKRMKTIRGISAAVMALGLSSCLEVNETVTLKKDGSGTIVEETILGAQASAMMQMAALQGGGEAPDMFGEESAKKRAEKFGKGVTVAKVEKINENGKTGSRVTFQFTDINTVTLDLSDGASSLSAMSPDAAAAAEEKAPDSQPFKFTYQDGQLTIINPKPKKEDADAAKAALKDAAAKDDTPAAEEDAGAEAAQMQAMAMQMMKDMKMSLKIVIEPGIAETDATHRDGNTITLMEMDMGKLMANPEVMKQMQGLDIQDPDALEKKLKGIEGVKGEEKEKVTVKVK
jgi:hypothetical protein